MKLPMKALPHASTIRSPGAAESRHLEDFRLAATEIVLPVVGVVLIAVLSNFGNSGGRVGEAG